MKKLFFFLKKKKRRRKVWLQRVVGSLWPAPSLTEVTSGEFTPCDPLSSVLGGSQRTPYYYHLHMDCYLVGGLPLTSTTHTNTRGGSRKGTGLGIGHQLALLLL